MTTAAVSMIQDIYAQAVDAVKPETVLPRWVAMRPDGVLTIGERSYDTTRQPVFTIAIGKAAEQMSVVMGDLLRDQLAGSIAVTKDPAHLGSGKTRVLLGAHPVPDERSLEAGGQVLEFAAAVPKGALVICLISGGGSALMESLRPGVTLDDLRDTTRNLLRAGASIHELNAVRARMSQLKAGGLLSALGHAEVVNLIISDVLGDELSTIASGPTVPRVVSEAAEAVLSQYGVEADLPDLDSPEASTEPYSLIVANVQTAVRAASDAAEKHGLTPVVLSCSLTGEARNVANAIASIVADSAEGLTSFRAGVCLLAGGETTVTVRGNGRGGRNTESALAAAIRIMGIAGTAIGFLATDGDDAETTVAGGIVTGDTIETGERIRAQKALDANDSYTFLQAAGAAWGNGPTGTNVNDLIIGVLT
jgi:glycerate 2-kinase